MYIGVEITFNVFSKKAWFIEQVLIENMEKEIKMLKFRASKLIFTQIQIKYKRESRRRDRNRRVIY